MSAIATPINATVNPVCACDTRSTIAIIKIIVLIMKSFLFSIASLGLGKVEGSTFSFLFAESSFLNAKKKNTIIAISAIPAIRPVFVRKSAKL